MLFLGISRYAVEQPKLGFQPLFLPKAGRQLQHAALHGGHTEGSHEDVLILLAASDGGALLGLVPERQCAQPVPAVVRPAHAASHAARAAAAPAAAAQRVQSADHRGGGGLHGAGGGELHGAVQGDAVQPLLRLRAGALRDREFAYEELPATSRLG